MIPMCKAAVMSGHTHIHTYTHTYTHDNYYNPRCAYAPRVNNVKLQESKHECTDRTDGI